LWCGGGHLHRDCPEKDNSFSIPACCNCQLAEGEKAYLTNYRGCRHAKEEMPKKKKLQETRQNKTGKVFSSNFRRPNVSFAAAVRDQTKQQRQQEEVANTPQPQKLKRKETDQLVPVTFVNSEPQDKALKTLTVVHQIIKELKGAASEEDMAVAITKIVIKLMKEDGK
jgi:hypothetical protein